MAMYRFRSEATGDLLMTAPVGERILRAIGREPSAQGIIEAQALPAAIAALESAVAGDEARRGNDPHDDDDDKEREGGPAVRLSQRAWPMLDMMRRSLAAKADIVWGV